MTHARCTRTALILLASAQPRAFAENWPQWRGPNGDGTSPEKGLPVEWSKTKNVLWRLALPGPAGATPAAWGDRLFLTSIDQSDIVLLCVSSDGKELWRRKIGSTHSWLKRGACARVFHLMR